MTSFLKPLLILSVLAGGLMAKTKTSFLPKTFQAQFIKEEKSVLSGKTLKSQGNITYQYPGRIRMESTGNEKTIFVSNPFETYFYTPPVFDDVPGELTVNKAKSVPISKFFDSLEKGLKTNAIYEVKEKEGSVLLAFTKEGLNQMKIKSANLHFDGKKLFSHLKKVEITLDNDKKMTINLNHIKVNTEVSKNTFEFKAPENTRISR